MTTTIADLPALKALSARLGADPHRTQGAGGNTSLKADGLLHIKASGTWLAHALEREIFVPVRMAPLMQAFETDPAAAERAAAFVPEDSRANGLRPSIETTVHAVIPHDVVLHIHCVETIALAIRTDAAARVAERLGALPDVSVAMVPYRRPGVPLAHAIVDAREAADDVLVLGNHGLVVSGDSVTEAARRLEAVCTALAQPARQAPEPDLARLARLADGSPYRLPADRESHAVATDPVSLAHATKGSLYPDHVIFLGRGVTLLPDDETPASLAAAREAAGEPPALLLVVPGAGVLIHRSAIPGADGMARCLADVLARVPADAPLRVLTADEEHELTDWDAEKYRQQLARKAG